MGHSVIRRPARPSAATLYRADRATEPASLFLDRSRPLRATIVAAPLLCSSPEALGPASRPKWAALC